MGQYRFVSFVNQRYRNFPHLRTGRGNLTQLHQLWQQASTNADSDSLIFADQPRLIGQRFFSPNVNNLRKCLAKPPSIFLFQGYGWEGGGQDYLLPIDGDLESLTSTAVNVRDLINAFKPFRSPCALLLLDLVAVDAGLDSQMGINPISSENLLRAKQRGINVVARFSARNPGILAECLTDALNYYGRSMTLELLEALIRERLETIPDDNHLIILTANRRMPTDPIFPDLNQLIQYDSEFYEWLDASRQHLVASIQKWRSPKSGSMSWRWIVIGCTTLGMALIIGWATRGLFRVEAESSFGVDQRLASPIDQAYLIQIQAAKTHLRWQQASVFVRAIAELRKISPDSPQYENAQRQITQWSEVILDIAKGRAEVGNRQDAIAAAALVPPDQLPLYKEAQGVIQQLQ